MAYTSGSYNTNKYTTSSSGTIGLNLSWTLKSQSVANNTSTISWTLKSNGTMSSGNYVKAGPVTCTINGTKVVNTTSRFDMKGGGSYKKTGTITVTHGADGKKTVGFKVEAALYSASVNCKYKTDGSTDYRELPQINRYAQLGIVSDFTNNPERDGYPTIYYSNPAGTSLTTGLKCRLCWDNNGTTNYSSWVTLDDEGGFYTFTSSTLTAANITSMLNASPTTTVCNVTYELQSTFNGTDGSVTKAAVMNIVDSDPIARDLSYSDVNSSVVAKTGSSSIIVQKQSTLRVRAPVSTAQNGASISYYSLYINGNVYTPGTVSDGYVYFDFIQPSLSGTFEASLTTWDTRNNTAIKYIDVVIQPWEAPTALYTLERVSGFDTSTTLYVSGSISSVSGTNTMTIQEQHKRTDESTWSTAATIPNQTNVTLTLNNNYSWDVKVIVNDEYATTEYTSSVGKGIPIMFIDKDRNSVSINGYPDDNNQLYNDGSLKITGDANILGDIYRNGGKHLVFEQLWTGTLTTGSASFADGYDFFIVVGKLSSSAASYIPCTIPSAFFGTSNTQFCFADESNYVTFYMKHNSNDTATLTWKNSGSGSGRIFRVYGGIC